MLPNLSGLSLRAAPTAAPTEADRRKAAYAAARASGVIRPAPKRRAVRPIPADWNVQMSQRKIRRMQREQAADQLGQDLRDLIAKSVIDGADATTVCKAVSSWCTTNSLGCGDPVYQYALVKAFGWSPLYPAVILDFRRPSTYYEVFRQMCTYFLGLPASQRRNLKHVGEWSSTEWEELYYSQREGGGPLERRGWVDAHFNMPIASGIAPTAEYTAAANALDERIKTRVETERNLEGLVMDVLNGSNSDRPEMNEMLANGVDPYKAIFAWYNKQLEWLEDKDLGYGTGNEDFEILNTLLDYLPSWRYRYIDPDTESDVLTDLVIIAEKNSEHDGKPNGPQDDLLLGAFLYDYYGDTGFMYDFETLINRLFSNAEARNSPSSVAAEYRIMRKYAPAAFVTDRIDYELLMRTMRRPLPPGAKEDEWESFKTTVRMWAGLFFGDKDTVRGWEMEPLSSSSASKKSSSSGSASSSGDARSDPDLSANERQGRRDWREEKKRRRRKAQASDDPMNPSDYKSSSMSSAEEDGFDDPGKIVAKLDRTNYNIVMDKLEFEYTFFEQEWKDGSEFVDMFDKTSEADKREAWVLSTEGEVVAEWYEQGGPFYKTDLDFGRLAEWYVDEYLPLKQLEERALGTAVMDTSVPPS
jgi:hypothetical protein